MNSKLVSPIALILCAHAALFTVACDKEKAEEKHENILVPEDTTKSPEATAPTEETTDNATDTDTKKVEAKPAKSVEQMHKEIDSKKGAELRKTFLDHLKKGRKLVQDKKYDDGLKELEKARALDPNDATILSEIGFAAMLADKLELAKKANLDSVRFAKEDKLKGASLYNLGRIAEKEDNKDAAIKYYKQSLIWRKNSTVEKRLASLTDDVVVTPPQHQPCTLKKHATTDINTICQTLAKADDITDPVCQKFSDYSEPLANITFDTPNTGFTKAQIIHYYSEEDIMTEYYELAILNEAKDAYYTTPLFMLYNPGAFGIMSDTESPSFSLEPLMGDKDHPQLVVRMKHNRHDTDMGIDEYEAESTSFLIVIGEDNGEPKLLAQFADKYSYTRDVLGLEEESGQPVATHEGLPIVHKFDTQASFDQKGHLVLKKAQVGTEDPRLLKKGSYDLGSSEVRHCEMFGAY